MNKSSFKSYEFKFFVYSNFVPILIYTLFIYLDWLQDRSYLFFAILYISIQFFTIKYFLVDYLKGKYDNY